MIHRIVPNLNIRDASAGHDFYVEFLGLEKAFDLGWVASFRSPENRAIQVSLVSGDASAPFVAAVGFFFRLRPPREPRRVFFFGFGASSASAVVGSSAASGSSSIGA